MNRRTFTTAALGAAALTALSPKAAAATGDYATVILAPHQDDETIRLSTYIAFMSDRGDDLALITATDGSATKVRKMLGLTREQIVRWRDREQDAAWSWLTDGRGGTPIRLGFPDGQAQASKIRQALEAQFEGMSGKPEIYVANWHHGRPESYIGDNHPDHVACNIAAQDMADAHGVTVRYARHPLSPLVRSARYEPTTHQMHRIEGAVASYKVIGQRSVPSQLQAVLDNPTSVVTR